MQLADRVRWYRGSAKSNPPVINHFFLCPSNTRKAERFNESESRAIIPFDSRAYQEVPWHFSPYYTIRPYDFSPLYLQLFFFIPSLLICKNSVITMISLLLRRTRLRIFFINSQEAKRKKKYLFKFSVLISTAREFFFFFEIQVAGFYALTKSF